MRGDMTFQEWHVVS